MTVHVALLRAVNLGSHNKVKMADLRAALAARGFREVRTYLQSGNVVLAADDGDPGAVAGEVEAALAELGVRTTVIVRAREELAAVVARDPLGGVATEPKRYQVSFLAGEPDPEAVAAIEAADVAPEQVAIVGREIYAWHPDGVGRSPLEKAVRGAKLGVEATARNWNTVLALLEMAEAIEAEARG